MLPKIKTRTIPCPVCDGEAVSERERYHGEVLSLEDDCPHCGYFYSAGYGCAIEEIGLVRFDRSYVADDRKLLARAEKWIVERAAALEESRRLFRDPGFARFILNRYETALYSEADHLVRSLQIDQFLTQRAADYPLSYAANRNR